MLTSKLLALVVPVLAVAACATEELADPDPVAQVSANCSDFTLGVSVTAQPALTRTHAWEISLIGATDALDLAAEQVDVLPYRVEVVGTGATDSGWAARGAVVIENPAPCPVRVVAIAAEIAGKPLGLGCPTAAPFWLAPRTAVTCPYVARLPSAASRSAHVVVSTVGAIGGGEARAAIDFARATIEERAACIEVRGDRVGLLGATCADAAYEYGAAIGPFACGAVESVVDTVRYHAREVAATGATGAASWTVAVTVAPCTQTCTRTFDYWRRHAGARPPDYDAAWQSLPEGPQTPFFRAGASYAQVLWTYPDGNAYYDLARGYIAAELNGASGAPLAVVLAELAEARGVFEQYTPAQIAALRGDSTLLTRLWFLATRLDQFDRGQIGPGACSE